MMTLIEFVATLERSGSPGSRASPTGFYTDKDCLIEKLAGLGFDREMSSGTVTIRQPLNSAILTEAFEVVEKATGLRPCRHRFVSEKASNHFFRVTIHREYAKRDIDRAIYKIARPKHAVGTLASQTQQETYVIEDDARLKRVSIEFGSLFFGGLACTDSFREKLDSTGVSGLAFQRVDVAPSGKGAKRKHRRLWGLRSSAVLPPNLHPSVNRLGKPFDGSFSFGCYPDDGGEWIPVPRFRQHDLEKGEPFDFGLTRERYGNSWNLAFRLPVVSQAFRHAIAVLGVKGVEYHPIDVE